MNERLEKDAAYYWSWCILKRLRDMGLLTDAEVEKIRVVSKKRYSSQLLVS